MKNAAGSVAVAALALALAGCTLTNPFASGRDGNVTPATEMVPQNAPGGGTAGDAGGSASDRGGGVPAGFFPGPDSAVGPATGGGPGLPGGGPGLPGGGSPGRPGGGGPGLPGAPATGPGSGAGPGPAMGGGPGLPGASSAGPGGGVSDPNAGRGWRVSINTSYHGRYAGLRMPRGLRGLRMPRPYGAARPDPVRGTLSGGYHALAGSGFGSQRVTFSGTDRTIYIGPALPPGQTTPHYFPANGQTILVPGVYYDPITGTWIFE